MAFYHIFKCSTICYHGISNVFASHTSHKKSLHRLNTKCRATCVCVCVFIIERSSLMQTYLLFPRLNATHHKKSMKIVNVMGFDESKIVQKIYAGAPCFRSIIHDIIFFLEFVYISSWMVNFLWQEVGAQIQIQSTSVLGLYKDLSFWIDSNFYFTLFVYEFDTDVLFMCQLKAFIRFAWKREKVYV